MRHNVLRDFKLTLTNHSRFFNMHLNLSTLMFLHFAPHQSDATVAEKQAHILKLKSSKKKNVVLAGKTRQLAVRCSNKTLK